MNSRLFLTVSFFVACSVLAPFAAAQDKPATGCVPAHRMQAAQLYGQWAVVFTNPPAGLPAQAILRLTRHAEFSESLAGTVSRQFGSTAAGGHAARAALAGDLDEGMLLLDESSDNVSITGTWNGEMKPGSCGRVYQGLWKDTSASAAPDAPDVAFTLTKLP